MLLLSKWHSEWVGLQCWAATKVQSFCVQWWWSTEAQLMEPLFTKWALDPRQVSDMGVEVVLQAKIKKYVYLS